LDFLGFIRPNRGFSMGYGRKNKKILSFSIPSSLRLGKEPDSTLGSSSIA
jgi:hypothetical protein